MYFRSEPEVRMLTYKAFFFYLKNWRSTVFILLMKCFHFTIFAFCLYLLVHILVISLAGPMEIPQVLETKISIIPWLYSPLTPAHIFSFSPQSINLLLWFSLIHCLDFPFTSLIFLVFVDCLSFTLTLINLDKLHTGNMKKEYPGIC